MNLEQKVISFAICLLITIAGAVIMHLASQMAEFTDPELANKLLMAESYYGNSEKSWLEWNAEMDSIRTLKWPLYNGGQFAVVIGTLVTVLLFLLVLRPYSLHFAPNMMIGYSLIAIIASFLMLIGLYDELQRDITQNRIAFHDDAAQRSFFLAIPVVLSAAASGVIFFSALLLGGRFPAKYWNFPVSDNGRTSVLNGILGLIMGIPCLLAIFVGALFLMTIQVFGFVGSLIWAWLWLSVRAGLIQRFNENQLH